MREILFRGKRNTEDWVFGNLFIPDKEDAPTEICIGTNVIRITYDVIPETTGQYTGLTDKNGKKIFEGDIVKWNINFAIVWQDCKFVIKKDLISKAYDYVLSCFDGTELEVIGNIHDNPELLKGGAE